jgi:predicted transcriptional regulator of viral defense system
MLEDRESDCPGEGQIRGPRPDAAIGALAAGQHGVVSRAQLLDARLTPAMIDKRVVRGALVLLHRGVYAVGHASLRREGWWLAAVLAAGPGAVLSHRDAAALHDLRAGGGTRIDVSTPRERSGTAKIRVHGRRALHAEDVTTVEGIPVTTVARTLVDLAQAVAQDSLLKALGEAERQHKLDVRALEAASRRTRGRRGSGHAALEAALDEMRRQGTTLTRSPLEDRFIALLDAHDLPRPATNAHVTGLEGDAVWRQARLVVELDGWDAHKTRRAFQRDRTKGNALAAAGWTLLRFTHDDVVRRPHEVAAHIAAQLSRAA